VAKRAGARLRAGLRLVPETGDSSQTIVAMSNQVTSGVQCIKRWLLKQMKIASTSTPVKLISARKTTQRG
jgi:hypothetical protein